MYRIFLLTLFLVSFSFSKECSPYYNPEKYYEAPEYLIELLETHLKNQKIFAKASVYKEGFIEKNDTFYKKEGFIQQGDYIYPTQNGVWQYKIKDGYIDELNLSLAEIYRFKDEEIANTINDDLGNFWFDFIEDSYVMQLTPEQTLFSYNGEYFSFSVFIHGVLGDSTPLKGTVTNFWFKNYTKEVNKFILCDKEKNGSR